jgi:hypothetical protein
MNTRDSTFPTLGEPPALSHLSQPPTAAARKAVEHAPSRTPNPLAADPVGDAGDIEYASWIRLIQPYFA